MGRNNSRERADARRAAAAQRIATQSAIPAQAISSEVLEITEAESRAQEQEQLKLLNDHLCEDPVKCPHKGTEYDCFWKLPELTVKVKSSRDAYRSAA